MIYKYLPNCTESGADTIPPSYLKICWLLKQKLSQPSGYRAGSFKSKYFK